MQERKLKTFHWRLALLYDSYDASPLVDLDKNINEMLKKHGLERSDVSIYLGSSDDYYDNEIRLCFIGERPETDEEHERRIDQEARLRWKAETLKRDREKNKRERELKLLKKLQEKYLADLA